MFDLKMPLSDALAVSLIGITTVVVILAVIACLILLVSKIIRSIEAAAAKKKPAAAAEAATVAASLESVNALSTTVSPFASRNFLTSFT